jgi:SAM-dependent methyltransferase
VRLDRVESAPRAAADALSVIRDLADGYTERGGQCDGGACTQTSSFPYIVDGKELGNTILAHGTDLSMLQNHSYDMVLSSHSLEHFQNPLLALREWDRLLKPSGSFLLILPWPPNMYDRHRQLTTMQHLIQVATMVTGRVPLVAVTRRRALPQDYFDPSVERLERMHVEEIVRVTSLDAADSPQCDALHEKRREMLSPTNWQDRLHWHVFSFPLIEELLSCLGYEVLAMELVAPYHMIALSKKL